jgi:hypothetical protein
MRLVFAKNLLNNVTNFGESRFTIVNDSGEFSVFFMCEV